MFTKYVFKQLIKPSTLIKSNDVAKLSTNCSQLNQRVHSGQLEDLAEASNKRKSFFDKVENLIERTQSHRNFAVVHMYGSQHLVHEGDVIQIKKDIPAKLGERIKLEKCLMAGNDCITLIGRPLLDRTKVNVEVTPIEKTQSHTVNQHIITRKQQGRKKHRHIRYPITFVRINEITIRKDENS